MTNATPPYRWNTSAAAEAFDQAAEFIHPLYSAIQDQVLRQLPFAPDAHFWLVDLGGGSGRFAECVLSQFPNSRTIVVDQSEPFLALAERRLQTFGGRVTIIQRRLQEDWAAELPAAPQAIVSMSAIHHLDPAEKRSLFARCCESLSPGGVFINGDEYRPADDAEYLSLLEWWSVHMHAGVEQGRIPKSFQPTLGQWYDRNIARFGQPKKSGDDFLETSATQVAYLREAGFSRVEIAWAEKLWGVVVASKDAT